VRASAFGVVTACASVLAPAWADVVIENPHLKLALADSATCLSLTNKATDREWDLSQAGVALADVSVGGKTLRATSMQLRGDELTVRFADCDTMLTYAIERTDDWVVFRLASIAGTRPTSMTLLRLPAPEGMTIGPRLNAAWDEKTTICLMAANHQPDCRASGGKTPTLNAITQDTPGPKLEGAAVALIVCPTPEFRALARKASHAFGLLTNEAADGAPVKDTDLVRGSYWFLDVTEANVDRVIEYCELAGIRQVMMGFGSWCTSAGHYTFSDARYPHGIDGLKAVVAKLHEHGILVGMHTFVSKVSKVDPYVTPVPDRRFWKDHEMTLAGAITADQTEIATVSDLREWAGSPVAKQKTWEGGVQKHQEVIIDDEIVQYESIGPEGQWNTFLGCKRGAWGTRAAAHVAGAVGCHYGVDGCINGYIIDQETDLMDEVADRIAGIYNACDFDMVYFDGGEDVDKRRFNYYVSNFQEQAMRRFAKRPIVHMGTIMTHRLWHSFARSSTVDTYLNTLYGAIIAGAPPEKWPTVKDHIEVSVRYMLSVRADMMPGELGWFGIWPKGQNTDGLQLDEAEYLMCKSLGYDVPISLQTSFGQMDAHPLTPEILRIVKAYETLRIARKVPAGIRTMLQEKGADFAMVQDGGTPHFVRVEALPLVGGTHDVRAFVGDMDGTAVATIWHYVRDGLLVPDIDAGNLKVTTFDGDPIKVETENGKPVIPVGPTRTTLLAKGVSAADLRGALERAEVRSRPVAMIFLRAADYKGLTGEMALGSTVGVQEPEALSGDVLVCTGRPNMQQPQPWYAEYTVDIPRAGRWALWARVRYPSGADESFGIVRPDEPVTLQGTQVLGNCGVNEKKWHWTGRGGGVTSVPPAEPIIFSLQPGPFTFRIYAREGGGSAAVNPRLDLLCLTDDPMTVPTDEQARGKLRAHQPEAHSRRA